MQLELEDLKTGQDVYITVYDRRVAQETALRNQKPALAKLQVKNRSGQAVFKVYKANKVDFLKAFMTDTLESPRASQYSNVKRLSYFDNLEEAKEFYNREIDFHCWDMDGYLYNYKEKVRKSQVK